MLLIVGCDNAPTEDTHDEDCAGVAGGSAVEDDCGICDGLDGYLAGSCYDCSDTPNGDALEDECGVCDADLSNDCQDCSTYLHFNSSNLQAAYFLYDVKIENISIEEEDWIGAFNGDICVGAKQWDTSQCGGFICDIVLMGNNGFDETMGYCNTGDIPTFKIYDVSAGIIYNTTTVDEIPSWGNNNFSHITSTLEVTTISVSNCQ